MPQQTLQVVWRPEDAREVFERAATFKAIEAAAAPVVDIVTREPGGAMRPRALRRRLTIAGLGAILAGATLGTGIARADGLSFLDSLNNRGIYVYDASLAVANGWAVCDMLNTANGADVAAHVYINSTYADIPTPYYAGVWVVTAVEELCPWHDHRGQEL